MMLLRKRKAQSMIEYAILLAVVISAFLLLQGIVKRGVSGGMNEAASRMGEQYSVSNSVIQNTRVLAAPSDIIEETGTSDDGTLADFVGESDMAYVPLGTIEAGAHSLTRRDNQDFTSTTRSQTDAATAEDMRMEEYLLLEEDTTYENYILAP